MTNPSANQQQERAPAPSQTACRLLDEMMEHFAEQGWRLLPVSQAWLLRQLAIAESAAEQRSMERAARLEKALRRYEWLPDAHGNLCCPECFGHALHESGCALRALLSGNAAPQETPSGPSAKKLLQALRAADRLLNHNYAPWESSGGGDECPHGNNIAIPCRRCDQAEFYRAVFSGNASASEPPKAIPESLP